jgi:hypothetical protein
MNLYKRVALSATLLILVLSMATSAATTGKIAGVVTDQQTGEPLPGANVVVVGTQLGAATDIDGNFFIINIPPGTYSLEASMIGYAKVTVEEVLVRVDRTFNLDITLASETVQGEEVTIVAEKPIVEKDLTASQSTILSEELEQSWVTNVVEAISQENGIVTRGTFVSSRGGLFTDLNYRMDGTSLNSGVVGDNYSQINKTSVQEMRLLTGGYNAEYGSALSGVVDVVTKEGKGPITGRVQYRYRPAGIYHWGRYMYGRDLYDWTHFDLDYWTENDGGRPDLSPQERLQTWRDFIGGVDGTMRDYNKRPEWETEATISGGITSKLGFLLSARWKEGVNVFPQARKYNPEWNTQAKLTYRFNPSMKLTLNTLYGGYKSAGDARSFLLSNETSSYGARKYGSTGSQVSHPYMNNKYFPFTKFNSEMPEFMDTDLVTLKWNHILSPSTFYEVELSRFYENRRAEADNSRFFAVYPTEEDGWWNMRRNYVLGVSRFESLAGSPREYAKYKAEVLTLNGALTSQITDNHQIKAGLELKRSDLQYREQMVLFQKGPKHINWRNHWDGEPLTGAVYVQDKMEYGGMVVNAGLRFDFFNGMHDAPISLFDPFGVEYPEAGHNPNDPKNAWPGDDELPKRSTPWQYALAPRLGISHPITETTILHFTYGHFNKIPGWAKYYGRNLRWRTTDPDPVPHKTDVRREPAHGWYGNPLLEFEKQIQYEIGIDQEIAGMFRLDATLYYKEGKNLTTASLNTQTDNYVGNGGTNVSIYSSTFRSNYPISMPANVGHQDVRGIEVTLESRFSQMFQASLSYDLSYNVFGQVGWRRIYEPKMNIRNARFGLGDTDQRWNPTDKFKAVGNIFLPENFGPSLGAFKPLGDINVNLYFEAWSGRLYTAHFPERGDLSTEPLNRRWEPHYRTNLRLVKGINIIDGIRPEIGIEVRNLFNNKDLNRPGGKELEQYLYEGELWVNEWSGEPDEWDWYSMTLNPPRQIYFTLAVNF